MANHVKFSEEFKKASILKFLNRGDRTISEVAEEVGISQSLYYHWRDKFAMSADMKKTTPQKKTTKEKLKLLAEYESLSKEMQGEFLRKNGLHSDHLYQWSQQLESALSLDKSQMVNKSELISEQKKVRDLERELKRKEKALAEAAALLILKKKADLIWGAEEDE